VEFFQPKILRFFCCLERRNLITGSFGSDRLSIKVLQQHIIAFLFMFKPGLLIKVEKRVFKQDERQNALNCSAKISFLLVSAVKEYPSFHGNMETKKKLKLFYIIIHLLTKQITIKY